MLSSLCDKHELLGCMLQAVAARDDTLVYVGYPHRRHWRGNGLSDLDLAPGYIKPHDATPRAACEGVPHTPACFLCYRLRHTAG